MWINVTFLPLNTADLTQTPWGQRKTITTYSSSGNLKKRKSSNMFNSSVAWRSWLNLLLNLQDVCTDTTKSAAVYSSSQASWAKHTKHKVYPINKNGSREQNVRKENMGNQTLEEPLLYSSQQLLLLDAALKYRTLLRVAYDNQWTLTLWEMPVWQKEWYTT